MKYRSIPILVISAFLMVSGQLHGTENTGHQEQENHTQSMGTMQTMQDKDTFLEKKEIDDYTVSFHVMKADPEAQQEGSHNFMVKVEKQGEILGDVTINSKIIYPSGKSESKFLSKMGDWYMKDFTLDEDGKYQLIILFKTSDGKKHKGGVYYEQLKNVTP